MLSPQQVQEMVSLVQRIQAGSVSRADWATLAALTLVSTGDDVCAAIAAQGLNTFIATSRPVYDGHGFHYGDYVRIYARVCTAATRYQRDLVRS